MPAASRLECSKNDGRQSTPIVSYCLTCHHQCSCAQEFTMATAFDLDQFVMDCRAAHDADSSHKLVREVVARAVSDPPAVLKVLGEPKRAEIQKLYHSDTLTIIK